MKHLPLEPNQPIYYVVKRKQKIDRFGHSAIRNQVWNNLRMARWSAEQWAREGHTTFIMCASGEKLHVGDGEFYLVARVPETTYLPDTIKPHRKHYSLESATSEHYRLSQLGGTFAVLYVIETFIAAPQEDHRVKSQDANVTRDPPTLGRTTAGYSSSH